MALSGTKPHIAEKILNHAVGRIEQTYDRYDYLDEKRLALDKLGREIDKIIGNGTKSAKVVKLRRQA